MVESLEKIEERALLLRRLYWLDEIHKIGKELNIDSIKEVENYWDLDHKSASSQISKILSDNSLLELVSRHPPKYLEMGGFHGQFYTLEEKNQLQLTGSWEIISKNVKRAIEKYKEKSYGTLKALVNKNGKSSYIDLLTEIEKILDKDYTPTALLSRLTILKLVFKTGSNKYPTWEIPQEILPVVKNEIEKITLNKIKKTTKIRKSKKQKFTTSTREKILSRDLRLDSIVYDLVDIRSNVNLIFHNRHSVKLFKDNEKAIMRITKPCGDEEEFSSRINWLSVIVTDDFELTEAKKLIKNSKIKGSIDFMEKYLNEKNIYYDENLIKNFRMLKILRNKKYPTHPDDGKFLDATTHFGQSKFPLDWTTLWESVLKSVTESFRMLMDAIQEKK